MNDNLNKNNLKVADDSDIQRNHNELLEDIKGPKEGFSFVPIFLIFIFAFICFWGGIYRATKSGEFRWDAYNPDYVSSEKPTIKEKPLIEIGEKIYIAQCVQCHQTNGQGISGVYPTLVKSNWVTDNKEVVSRILINGLNGKIEVNGKIYNGNMPAFGPNGLNLRSKQIAGVLTYIRKSWGNDASEITLDEFQKYYDLYKARSLPWDATGVKENLSLDVLDGLN